MEDNGSCAFLLWRDVTLHADGVDEAWRSQHRSRDVVPRWAGLNISRLDSE